MSRTLVIVGALLVVAGVLWPWLSRLPLGRLPGDLVIERDNLRIYIPFTTMVLLSLAGSLVVWLLRR